MEHREKQRKRKDLPDTMVYGSQNKVVELHNLGDYEVEKKKLKIHIIELIEENKILNTRVDNTKTALKTMLDRVEIIERKLKTYGLE
jgi:regulator of replication initiation timing